MLAAICACWTGSQMSVPPCARKVDIRNWKIP